MGRKPPNAGKGRKAGVPNKVTTDVRTAMARLAEGNVERVQAWLDVVAQTDPARACEIFLRLIEYHIPKLARTEIGGTDGQPLGAVLQVVFTPNGGVSQ